LEGIFPKRDPKRDPKRGLKRVEIGDVICGFLRRHHPDAQVHKDGCFEVFRTSETAHVFHLHLQVLESLFNSFAALCLEASGHRHWEMPAHAAKTYLEALDYFAYASPSARCKLPARPEKNMGGAQPTLSAYTNEVEPAMADPTPEAKPSASGALLTTVVLGALPPTARVEPSHPLTEPLDGLGAPMPTYNDNPNPSPLSPMAEMNQQAFSAMLSGAEAGVAAGAVQVLVTGVVMAFPDLPILAKIAAHPLGRSFLGLAIPYALLTLATQAPSMVPGNPELLRRVCLAAIRGQSTLVLLPLVARVMSPVNDFVGRMSLGGADPSVVAAAASAMGKSEPAPAPAPAPAP
jgi:hypothetical protein